MVPHTLRIGYPVRPRFVEVGFPTFCIRVTGNPTSRCLFWLEMTTREDGRADPLFVYFPCQDARSWTPLGDDDVQNLSVSLENVKMLTAKDRFILPSFPLGAN